MINIIIGKDSNLTNALTKHLSNTIIFSVRDSKLTEKIKLLNRYKKINLIFNNFYPAARINNLNHINLRRIGINDKYINAGSLINCLDEADINISIIKNYIND